jgi:hypothetical protein
MKKTTYYILQGGPKLIEDWRPVRWPDGSEWYWTAHKDAKPGDRAFVYLTAPLSRIIGEVMIVEQPWLNSEPYAFDNPIMHGKWCSEVGHPVAYSLHEEGLTIAGLRRLFADEWPWLRYPRGNTRVPDEILPMLLELAGIKTEICKNRKCRGGFIVHDDWKASRTMCPECNGH